MSNSLQLTNIGELVTANSAGVERYQNSSLCIENGTISSISDRNGDQIIDCGGKMVTAGFVDSHTHPVFYNKRDEEYRMRLSGATYEEIAENGGGIISSVEGVRNASKEALVEKV